MLSEGKVRLLHHYNELEKPRHPSNCCWSDFFSVGILPSKIYNRTFGLFCAVVDQVANSFWGEWPGQEM
jgi:hypothetical protein